MALPLIPLVGLGFLVTWLVLYGMTHGLQTWLASLLNALAHPQGTFWQKVLLKPVALAAQAIQYVFRTVGHSVSQAAAHGIPRVALYLGSWASWIQHHAVQLGDFAEETAVGFERLVAHTIPHAVARAIAIPIHEVQIGLRHAERDLERLRIYARGIDRLVRDSIIPGLRAVAHAVDVTLPHSIAGVRSRVGSIEKRIANPSAHWVKAIWKRGWILVGAGLMLRFLVRKFPHLFCRNTTKGLKALCNTPSQLLDVLLGDALAAIALLDICDTIKAIELVADQFEPIIEGLVKAEDDFFDHCGHDIPSAADPPGYSGPWLATTL